MQPPGRPPVGGYAPRPPPPPTTWPTGRGPLIALATLVVVLLGAAGLVGWLAFTAGHPGQESPAAASDKPEETSAAEQPQTPAQTAAEESPQATEDPVETNIFDLAVGDCIADTLGTDDIETVGTVDCAGPHHAEIYDRIALDDGSYPGDSEVSGMAEERCIEAFADFVGIDFANSMLGVEYLHPTQASWEVHGDRDVLCLVFDPTGDTTGTLEGATI